MLIFNQGKPKTFKRVGAILTTKTMKKSFKNLQLKKEVIMKFDLKKVNGGYGPTALMCNSVPRHLGGIGCHLK